MDKMHFYVYQTDANMSYYLIKAVFDSGRCTHDETLMLMNACSHDVDEPNNGDDDKTTRRMTRSLRLRMIQTKKFQAMTKKVERMVLMRMVICLLHLRGMQLGQVADSYGTYLVLASCTLFVCAN